METAGNGARGKVNQGWGTDITYIRMAQGFVYLVAVIDWFSPYILSWEISISLEADFCIEALEDTIEKHGQPEIFNTDQGSQFTSKNFIAVLTASNASEFPTPTQSPTTPTNRGPRGAERQPGPPMPAQYRVETENRQGTPNTRPGEEGRKGGTGLAGWRRPGNCLCNACTVTCSQH